MRMALCHEWLTTLGGSDLVAARIAQALSIDTVFVFTKSDELAKQLFPETEVRTTSMGRSEFVSTHWKAMLPVMAAAWRSVDLSNFDVVITSSHAAVNSIRPRDDAVHISYCHTPMRYAWEWRVESRRVPRVIRPAWPLAAAVLREGDRRRARRVDHFIANSQTVRNRIRDHYRRDAPVIYPPVDVEFWTPTLSPDRGYFLYAGRLVAYKQVDVAIAAANQAEVPLVIAGSGPELDRLRSLAGPTVRFVRAPSREKLRDLFANARAFVFPGFEDFGMAPVEAMACGTPVIARNTGGVAESVLPGIAGILFDADDVDQLSDILTSFDSGQFASDDVRANALRFSADRFDAELKNFVRSVLRAPELVGS